jgi:hypothetical protein
MGSFAASELVNLRIADNKLHAVSFAMVLSHVDIPAVGNLDLCAVNEKVLASFAGVCPSAGQVEISVAENKVRLRCKNKEATVPFTAGQDHSLPTHLDSSGIEVSKENAVVLAHLADIAFNDQSRPELCCVMFGDDSTAMACSPKGIAVLKYHGKVVKQTAFPVPLAKAVQSGDRFYFGPKETMLVSGIGKYCMSTPVRAQKDFPVAAVRAMGKASRKEAGRLKASLFGHVLEECNKCLGALSRTDVVINIKTGKGRLELFGANGGLSFRRQVSAVVSEAGIELNAPLDELIHLIPIAASASGEVRLSCGGKGELYVTFDSGWALFPTWKPKSK